MRGKDKCKILKEIRRRIAEENGIAIATRECTFQGECKGTCPKCEQELRELEQQLEKRRRLGKAVAVTALTAGLLLGAVGCPAKETRENRTTEPQSETATYTELAGEIALPETTEPTTPCETEPELTGDFDVPLPPEQTEEVLTGMVAITDGADGD